MRIAILSDIHGNLVALEAVLADLATQGAEQMVCLGDLAFSGPQPHECVALIRALGWEARRVVVDAEAMRAAARASGMPHPDRYRGDWRQP